MGDRERNFARKADALAWLVELAKDERKRPLVKREPGGAYRYYGPGRDVFVTRARIFRLTFPAMRRRRAPKGGSLVQGDTV